MTSSYNLFTAYHLPRHIRNKLYQEFFYTNEIRESSVSLLKGLKEWMITGPIEVTILNENHFEIALSLRQYHEAICKRHFYGVRHINRLEQSALRLSGVVWSSAWTLTTSYYSAYFAALELLEAAGHHISYISPTEADILTGKAPHSRFSLKGGAYLGKPELDAARNEVIITYHQNSSKPHEFAWQELDVLIRAITMADDAKAVQHQSVFRRFLGAKDKWKKPNEVRNLWNYSEPTFFSEEGEQYAKLFNSHVKAPSKVVKWSLQRHLHNCNEHEAAGIAYIQTSLRQAIDDLASAILPEELAKQCA